MKRQHRQLRKIISCILCVSMVLLSVPFYGGNLMDVRAEDVITMGDGVITYESGEMGDGIIFNQVYGNGSVGKAVKKILELAIACAIMRLYKFYDYGGKDYGYGSSAHT